MMHSNAQLRPSPGEIIESISRNNTEGRADQESDDVRSIQTTAANLSLLKSLIKNINGVVEEDDMIQQITTILMQNSSVLFPAPTVMTPSHIGNNDAGINLED